MGDVHISDAHASLAISRKIDVDKVVVVSVVF